VPETDILAGAEGNFRPYGSKGAKQNAQSPQFLTGTGFLYKGQVFTQTGKLLNKGAQFLSKGGSTFLAQKLQNKARENKMQGGSF